MEKITINCSCRKRAFTGGENMSLRILGQQADTKALYPYLEGGGEKQVIILDPADRYRLIVESAANVILIIDSNDFSLIFISPAFQRILGYNARDILGQYSLDFIHPEDRTDALDALIEGIKAGHGMAKYRVIKNDGTLIWVESFGEILYDKEGNKEILIIARDITESKLTVDALQHAEESYRLIVDNAREGISIISSKGLEGIYANPAVLDVTGYTKEEFVGRGELDYIHPEDRKHVLALAKGMKKRQATNLQFRYRKKDGKYIWVETTGRILPGKDVPSEILLISRDISHRKKADEALRRSELRLRQITDNMLDSVCTLDAVGVFQYVSPSQISILGFDPAEMIGRQNHHLLHPFDFMRVKQFIRDIIEHESNGKIEYRARHKDGHYVWLESVCQVFIDDYSGEKQLIAGTRDISARKQAEADLWQREEDLRNKVNYLNTLINNMNELFYTFDRDYRLTFGNQKTIEVTGYSLEESLGRFIVDFVPDTDKDYVMENARKRIEQGVTGSYEHYITCKDGREILVKVKSSPIIEDNRITGIMVLAEDITAQRKLEKEMIRLGQFHTVGEMAASIGHEIRNPMTTVYGFLQIMSQNEQLSEYQPYFDLMLEELGRANSIITEFLSLAKDKLVDLQCQQINDIVKALAPLLVADAIKGDKHISFNLGNVCDLQLDQKEIGQLILNLVRNGLEAMSAGGTVYIETTQDPAAGQVILTVRDEGGGIRPEMQDQLGTPFITNKENGIGLGLAICYSIVDRHQARMDYETSPAGTAFKVKFPI